VTAGHPPPPWRLRGALTLVPAPVRLAAARRFRVPGGARLLGAGWTPGGVLLADYRAGTLAYRELIVFSGLALAGGRPGLVVSHIYVDSEASLSGGREIWGLPKEPAEFTLAPGRFEARQGATVLLRATLRHRRRGLALPVTAPAIGELDGAAVLVVGHARLRAAPALVTLDVPPESPFAALGLSGTRLGLAAAELDLVMPAPPRRRAGTPGRRTAS